MGFWFAWSGAEVKFGAFRVTQGAVMDCVLADFQKAKDASANAQEIRSLDPSDI